VAELHLLSPRGFIAGGVYAGIRTKITPDVGLLACHHLANAAAVFTTNTVVAAPVVVGREHIASGKLRGVVMNSGNANACTGAQGLRDANAMCKAAGKILQCDAAQILPSSTGIIGHHMPMEKVLAGIDAVGQQLGDSAEHALAFADAILTTDLVRKSAATEFKVGRETVRIAGVCKGSGMIGPRLSLDGGKKPLHATMLGYLTTDAKISSAALRKLLDSSSRRSFNNVTVDDHASTNDTAAILASGLGAAIDSPKALSSFGKALDEVCQSLAYQIAADGEGATKVVKIIVRNAATESDATAMARAIANSPLVKCAMHGNDPNWGRIVSAAGFAGAKFDADRSVLTLQGTVVFRHGTPSHFDRATASKSLDAKDVSVDLNCRLGDKSATVWTCDLSREYITINADYHT
jgi:glutamate N-acetyltransferase / amino-acid N-acetyltransferase